MEGRELPEVQRIHIGPALCERSVALSHTTHSTVDRLWSSPTTDNSQTVCQTHLYEQVSHLIVSIGACIVQRYQPTLVLSMDISTMFHHQLNNTHTVVAGSQVEGGGLCVCVCVLNHAVL